MISLGVIWASHKFNEEILLAFLFITWLPDIIMTGMICTAATKIWGN